MAPESSSMADDAEFHIFVAYRGRACKYRECFFNCFCRTTELLHSIFLSTDTMSASSVEMKREGTTWAPAVRGLQPICAPSILSADFALLAPDVKLVHDAGAEWIHVDVFDGNFVPNLTIGPPVVKAIRKHCPDAFLDCHLCVLNPENYVEDMKKAGASQFTFHWEARGVDESLDQAKELIKAVKDAGMQVGCALAPETPADVLFPLVDEGLLDTVLLMSVRPGFGGQKFMASVLPKVEALRKRNATMNVQVDGGITLENAKDVALAGANVLVAGSTVYSASSPPPSQVRSLVNLISEGLAESRNFE